MPLSNKILNDFVKATTKSTKKEKKEKFVYGHVSRFENNKYYVRLDGSVSETPIARFAAVMDIGKRVIVMIKNHEAIVTGNVDEPAGYVEEVDTTTGAKKLRRVTSKQYVDDAVNNINIESVELDSISALWNEYFE